jgi:hypothetical protein
MKLRKGDPAQVTVIPEMGIPRQHVINNLEANEEDLLSRIRFARGLEKADLEAQLQAVRARLRSLGRRIA